MHKRYHVKRLKPKNLNVVACSTYEWSLWAYCGKVGDMCELKNPVFFVGNYLKAGHIVKVNTTLSCLHKHAPKGIPAFRVSHDGVSCWQKYNLCPPSPRGCPSKWQKTSKSNSFGELNFKHRFHIGQQWSIHGLTSSPIFLFLMIRFVFFFLKANSRLSTGCDFVYISFRYQTHFYINFILKVTVRPQIFGVWTTIIDHW